LIPGIAVGEKRVRMSTIRTDLVSNKSKKHQKVWGVTGQVPYPGFRLTYGYQDVGDTREVYLTAPTRCIFRRERGGGGGGNRFGSSLTNRLKGGESFSWAFSTKDFNTPVVSQEEGGFRGLHKRLARRSLNSGKRGGRMLFALEGNDHFLGGRGRRL